MSILEKITSILDTIEEMNGKLDRLLASGSNKFTVDIVEGPKKETILQSPGFENNYKPNEEVDMDFSKVLVMNQTDKALLVVKKGLQQWLAKSLMQGGGDGYDNGNTYDIAILEISPKSQKPTKWVFKKWEKFEVVKN